MTLAARSDPTTGRTLGGACICRLVVFFACAVGASGCGGRQSASIASTDAPEPSNPFMDALPDTQSGLEVQSWAVTDRDSALASALAAYENEPTPMPASVRANWRRNGLRMVRIPIDEMGSVLSSLPIEGQVNKVWLGQSPAWTVAARGTPWSGSRSLLIDGETIRLGTGQLRLLVRAWISPTESTPKLHTDLALQYLDSPRDSFTRSPFDQAALRRAETEGLIFRTLTAPMELAGRYAYCIVSEDPNTDWGSMTEPDDPVSEPQSPTLPELAPDPFGAIPEPIDDPSLGPEPPGIPLLADALLSRVELLPTRRQARSIVILTPIIPDQYRLTPAQQISTPR